MSNSYFVRSMELRVFENFVIVKLGYVQLAQRRSTSVK